jgi:3-dehydroquinate dehydratase
VRLDVTALHFQSNYEGALTVWIHDRQADIDGYVVNPAGLAPYGYSKPPALSAERDGQAG